MTESNSLSFCVVTNYESIVIILHPKTLMDTDLQLLWRVMMKVLLVILPIVLVGKRCKNKCLYLAFTLAPLEPWILVQTQASGSLVRKIYNRSYND
jgi:hypothetical protein